MKAKSDTDSNIVIIDLSSKDCCDRSRIAGKISIFHWKIWLRPIPEEYERATNHPKSSPIHIHGWGNIEESVEISRFEGMKRGHRDLKVKYRGHDLVQTILQREKEVKEIGAALNQAVESLSQQRVFSGSCEVCSL